MEQYEIFFKILGRRLRLDVQRIYSSKEGLIEQGLLMAVVAMIQAHGLTLCQIIDVI